MAESKKISELQNISSVSNEDEFIVVDKSIESGADASSTGKTSKITFSRLKTAVGSQGSPGEKGEKGEQGNSVTGPAGPAGPQGAQGISIQGDPGPAGPKGPQGNSVTGPKGPQGNSVTGPKGPQGNSVTGPKGPQGNSITGPKGPQGNSVTGPKGPQGNSITGPKGPQGNSVTGPKGPQGNSVTGPKGPQGPTGASGVFTGGTVSGHTTYSGISTFQNDIRFEGSYLEIGDYHVDDSILDMSCRSIGGASNHQGRIRFVPSHGQAMYRVRGYIDLMTDSVSDNPWPVVRIQGAYTSSSFQNAVMQNNRIKLEVKGTINATESITSISFLASGADASEIENIKNTELNGIQTISKLKISDFTLDGKQKTGIVAQDLQSVLPTSVSSYEEDEVVKPAIGNVVYFNDNTDEEAVIHENISLNDLGNQRLPENQKFIQTHPAETQKINKLAYSTNDIITALVKSVQEQTELIENYELRIASLEAKLSNLQ